MKFTIPSYKRHDRQDTLKWLLSVGIPRTDIYLFVQTEEDYGLYKQYEESCHLIYKEAQTLPNARNNILDYFQGSYDIVMLDDDISALSCGSKEQKLVDITSHEKVMEVFETMFAITRRLHGSLCGFYPVHNNFFMQDSIDTKKPVNTIIGFPRGFNSRFDVNFIAKEDIELCGRVLASNGKIIRLNNISFNAKHRTNQGGANDVWKSGVNKEYAEVLEQMYPEIYAVQKNNPEEVRTVTCGGRIKFRSWKV